MGKKLIALMFCFLVIPCLFAETVTLKNGTVIKGEVVEKGGDYVKINFQGVVLTYYLEDIVSIEGERQPEQSSGQLFAEAAPAVVVIRTRTGDNISLGSGFIVDPDGTVVTAFHLVGGTDSVWIKPKDEKLYPVSTIVAYDIARDLCILKIDASGLPSLSLNSYPYLSPGQKIVVISTVDGREHSSVEGVYGGKVYDHAGRALLRFKAPLPNTDVAGSPLLDAQGRIIGVVVQGELNVARNAGRRINFALPIKEVRDILASPSAISMEEFSRKVGPVYRLYRLGYDAAEQGDDQNAIDYLNQALGIMPGFLPAHHVLVNIYESSGMYDQAVKQWKRVLKANPNDPVVCVNIAVACYRQDKKAEAFSYAQQAIHLGVSDAAALADLALVYEKENELDQAFRLARRAVDKDSELPLARNNLGYVYQQKKMFKEAVREYKAAIDLDPYYLQPYVNLVWLALGQEQPDMAAQYYREAEKLGLKLGADTEEKIRPYL